MGRAHAWYVRRKPCFPVLAPHVPVYAVLRRRKEAENQELTASWAAHRVTGQPGLQMTFPQKQKENVAVSASKY